MKYIEKKLYDIIDMPKEVIMDLACISITGNEKMRIENYKSVLEYKEGVIRIDSKSGVIKIIGNKMQIKNIKEDDILITGNIFSIEFKR